MAVTSSVTLALRVVMIGVLSAALHNLNTQMDDYNECRDKGNSRNQCNHHLVYDGENSQQNLINLFIVSLVLAISYLIVSFCGASFGFTGASAEAKAKANAPPPQQPVAGQAQTVIVLQAQAVPQQAQVQVVQAQPVV
jgi:flagellar basal body-associated protein FliL